MVAGPILWNAVSVFILLNISLLLSSCICPFCSTYLFLYRFIFVSCLCHLQLKTYPFQNHPLDLATTSLLYHRPRVTCGPPRDFMWHFFPHQELLTLYYWRKLLPQNKNFFSGIIKYTYSIAGLFYFGRMHLSSGLCPVPHLRLSWCPSVP